MAGPSMVSLPRSMSGEARLSRLMAAAQLSMIDGPLQSGPMVAVVVVSVVDLDVVVAVGIAVDVVKVVVGGRGGESAKIGGWSVR